MKSTRYIIISCVFILFNTLPLEVNACWFPKYKPSEYYVFYTYEKKDINDYEPNRSYKLNIAEWIDYTNSTDICYDDVKEVVYEYSPMQLNNMLKGDTTNYSKNSFLKYLIDKKDKEVIQYLILAKDCEVSRAIRNDEWWYPTKDDLEYRDMKDIIDRALAYKGKKLKIRYLLQAIRAAYTMQDYDLCLDLWEKYIKKTPRTAVKSLCEEYIGGIYFKRGDYQTAVEHYGNAVDVSDSFWWYINNKSKSDIERLKVLYKYAPKSSELAVMVQKICREAEEYANTMVFDDKDAWAEYHSDDENDYYYYSGYKGYKKNRERYLSLRDFALQVTSEKRTDNPAMWQYTAAFLTLLDGKPSLASQYAKRAEKMKGTSLIKNNIKVLDIMIDAITGNYDSKFEAQILPKLKWLDKMTANNLTEEVKTRYKEYSRYSDHGTFYNYSEYYYNDMMRKITLSIMSPRYLKKGQTVKTILLNGLASERMRMLTNYRKSRPDVNDENFWNSDFYTDVFIAMDTLSVDNVIAYKNKLYGKNKTPFERFLSDRCYKNKDYFNEIIGTKYMRIERFDKAVEYLSMVSQGYDSTLNIYHHFRYDPFTDIFRKFRADKPIKNYKLNFASYMLDLQKIINTAKNNEVKADAYYKYGLGMQQALNNCWPLLRYKNGSDYNLGPDNFDTWSKPLYAHLNQSVKTAIDLTTRTSYSDWELIQCDRFTSYIEKETVPKN
ncbi:MAG: hypothetical protein E6767_08845 [Dysgonomonas sp.]|nr:hypothetical protein [Dysgonomonas sp.]